MPRPLIDRMADAIIRGTWTAQSSGPLVDFAANPASVKAFYRRVARAALAFMRSPEGRQILLADPGLRRTTPNHELKLGTTLPTIPPTRRKP